MENINIVFDPIYWKIVDEKLNIDDFSDVLYKVMIGLGEEDSVYEIYELISKDNYDKLLNNIYEIEKFPYSINKILLFDNEGSLIPLIKTQELKKEKLSSYQKEIVNKKYLNINKKKIKRM